mmetsp:Transcript_102999/g.291721  ORF Transcript_102999/g.291721 Transcript_102999/m.291721 type:complete len:279 (+) Transcript_102999:812-1648(+)
MLYTTNLLGVLEVLGDDIPREACRSVVHRSIIRHGLEAAVGGADFQLARAVGKLGVQDANGYASGAEILLRARVDVRMLRNIDRLGHKVGRHVCDKRHVPDVGGVAELDTVHRLVGAVVDVRGILVDLPGVDRRDGGVFGRLGVADVVRDAVLLALLGRLVAPLAGDDVVGLGLGAEHVEGHGGELQCGAALRENDLVVARDPVDVPEVLLGLRGDGHVLLRAVRHLHHAHARALVVHELLLHLLEHLQRHLTGAGREVVDAALCHRCGAGFNPWARC